MLMTTCCSAPCIRGHRSTKCNHFNERVMVPVRKPGRPLSTCPCPPGRPCACGGVKVAIPRKQKCGCGPEASSEAASTPKERTPPETPTSPTRSSYRVTKLSSSTARTNGRKQSLPANLARIDPMSVNIVTPNGNSLDAMTMAMVSNGIVAQAPPPSLAGYGTAVGYISASPGGQFPPAQNLSYGSPLAYNMNLQYSHQTSLPPQEIKSEDGNMSPIQPPSMVAPMPPPAYTNGGGHSRSSSLNGTAQLVDLGPPLMPRTNGSSKPSGGSCCGGNKETPQFETDGLPPPHEGFDKPFIPQYAPTLDLKQQPIQSPFDFPTIFTYPAQYGSWNQPINPEIWQQVQQVASHPSMTLEAALPPSPTSGTGPDLGTSHQCSCGEGCQCVGCLAHPFNEQMFQYVNNAYTESNGSPGGVGSGSGAAGGGGGSCCGGGANGDSGSAPAQTTAPESPPEAQTPSDASALSEEQALSTMDYFFVNIPLRNDGSCGGNLHSCPCGDECECIGCLVHNAPPVSPE